MCTLACPLRSPEGTREQESWWFREEQLAEARSLGPTRQAIWTAQLTFKRPRHCHKTAKQGKLPLGEIRMYDRKTSLSCPREAIMNCASRNLNVKFNGRWNERQEKAYPNCWVRSPSCFWPSPSGAFSSTLTWSLKQYDFQVWALCFPSTHNLPSVC